MLSKYFGHVAAMPERLTQVERRSRSEIALLEAAAELVAERGVQGTSLASIGGRAGVSRGLPTHHFGSKDALVSQLAERAQAHIREVMYEAQQNHIAVSGDTSALGEIRVVVDAYLQLFNSPDPSARVLLVMWGSIFPSAASVEGMIEAERRSYEGLTDLVIRGQADGSVRLDIDAVASAVILHGLMRGVAGLFLSDGSPTDIDLVRRTCHQWISSALSAPGLP